MTDVDVLLRLSDWVDGSREISCGSVGARETKSASRTVNDSPDAVINTALCTARQTPDDYKKPGIKSRTISPYPRLVSVITLEQSEARIGQPGSDALETMWAEGKPESKVNLWGHIENGKSEMENGKWETGDGKLEMEIDR